MIVLMQTDPTYPPSPVAGAARYYAGAKALAAARHARGFVLAAPDIAPGGLPAAVPGTGMEAMPRVAIYQRRGGAQNDCRVLQRLLRRSAMFTGTPDVGMNHLGPSLGVQAGENGIRTSEFVSDYRDHRAVLSRTRRPRLIIRDPQHRTARG